MEKQITFRTYTEVDYEAVCDFLIDLNRADKTHINWNWARFEWMAEHPDFDKSLTGAIGLWTDEERIVGAAIYDMYFGEAFCGALPEYDYLYPEILDYAWANLKDEEGLGIAACDENAKEIEALKAKGFAPEEQTENIMKIGLDGAFPVCLPDGFHLEELDPGEDIQGFQWLLWQGFDHGEDRAAFEKEEAPDSKARKHFRKALSLAAAGPDKEKAAYGCLWYHEGTDYAYVEPVCTVPSHRGKGLAKAIIYEALSRVRDLGAKEAYVISDMDFYAKLGFCSTYHYTFYRKKLSPEEEAAAGKALSSYYDCQPAASML
ncbi:MAG: GNAT family N-acetyltransferase [Lachnospiraceae bacterium]|nr:GNAT family N-acetyltransferase [Lachnospiraceae bacterium]